MKRNDFVFAGFLALGAAAFFFFGRAPASSAPAAFEGKPEIVAATFASAWCSACKILKPRLAKAIPDFEGKPVKFIEYDFTFGARDETRDEARADGLGDVYDRFSKATGFTVLVDADTGEVVDTLTINHSANAMRAAIASALAAASQEPAGVPAE